MEFYSHTKPKKYLLKDHLYAVAKQSKEIIESKDFNFIDKNILANVSFLIGISHDFGKYTTFFQKKLSGFIIDDEYLSNHSFISALLGYEITKEYLTKIDYIKLTPYKYLPLISYFVIKHHHGNLINIIDDVRPERLFESFKRVSKQIQDIFKNKNKIFSEYKSFKYSEFIHFYNAFYSLKKYDIPISRSNEIPKLIEELNKASYHFNLENSDTTYYFITLLLYSVLIDSDKKHAGDVRKIKRIELPDNLVDIYLNSPEFKKINQSKINNIRREIYHSVTSNILKDENLNQKIFTITAPTGTGKTLTSLSAALKLRKKLKEVLNSENAFRIIYALPFTSIIDQNYSVFEKVLKGVENFRSKENEYLLKHHHLSEVIYKSQESNEKMDVDESLALIESWESEIVVTTFIQFFYAVIGYKNRSLKKFHNIVNSIIILDEVQNIPIKYWSLVNVVLRNLSEFFNTRIILMTATKPLIFEDDEYVELVDNYQSYFEHNELNRVKINIDKKKQRLDEFAEHIKFDKFNSYLLVFNTVNAAYTFYQLTNERVNTKKIKLFYLSTNITPKERKCRINSIKRTIKNINKGESKFQKVIVISTQLIEAGVDIDCDCVYRDIGPLDSIIQVAGRCNRNKRFNLADLNLVNLLNEQDKAFSDFIYDPEFIFVLDKLLQDKNIVYEKDFLKIINQYFALVKQKIAEEKEIFKSITKLQFDKKGNNNNKLITISSFKLIGNDYPSVDIFVELNEKAQKVWNEYENIRDDEKMTGLEKRNAFLKIRKEFNDYIISVPEKYALPHFEKGVLNYISYYEVKNKIFYDNETGFKRENANSGILNPLSDC